MKKTINFIVILLITICLTACEKGNVNYLAQNIKKIELTGNLVTHEAYYHNILEYEKPAGSGVSHWFEKDRKLFAEYTGTIKLGIDLTKVKINVKGNQIDVYVPKATIIGEPNVYKDDFNKENFIESKDGLNKNKITGDDSAAALDKAQQSIKDDASNNTELLSIAQKRAKTLIEENIRQFSGLSDNQYIINWEYEQ